MAVRIDDGPQVDQLRLHRALHMPLLHLQPWEKKSSEGCESEQIQDEAPGQQAAGGRHATCHCSACNIYVYAKQPQHILSMMVTRQVNQLGSSRHATCHCTDVLLRIETCLRTGVGGAIWPRKQRRVLDGALETDCTAAKDRVLGV